MRRNQAEDFEHRIKENLNNVGLYSGDRIGVGLSGGADSVALLVCLNRLGYNVVGLHCNFNLRGDESKGDADFCVGLAERYGVELRMFDVDTVANRRKGESVEMVCRRLRYEWWEKIADIEGIKYIALGHHREDVVETVMLNLLRGTGIAGMTGIAVKRDIYIRPMLDVTRDEIEQYLVGWGIEWRVDSSNLANEYRRNALRNEILPLIRKYFADGENGILTTASNLADVNFARDKQACDLAGKLFNDGVLDIGPLTGDADMLVRVSRLCYKSPLSFSVAKDIVSERNDRSGGLFRLTDGSELELYDGKLRYPGENSGAPELIFEIIEREQFDSFSASHDRAWFDADVIDIDRLRVRGAERGDRMRPFGMKGSRLLSDIMHDNGVAPSARQSKYVLVSGDEILWLIGIRASDIARVTKSTRRILVVTVR